jgi:hypothetical protein
MASVIRIKPYHYIHVLDNNANTTRVEVGPQTFTSQVPTLSLSLSQLHPYVFFYTRAQVHVFRNNNL